MDRLQIRDKCRNIARIESHDINDAEMDTYLDEGYNRILMYTLWPWMYDTVPVGVTLVSGQRDYVLDTKVKQVVAVINRTQSYQLRSMSFTEFLRNDGAVITTTRPSHFYFQELRLSVFPIPASTDELEVSYITQPAWGPADIDVPPFNNMFHDVITDWTMHRLWEVEEDFDKSTEYRARFADGVQMMAEWYNDDMQDTPRVYGQSNAAHRPTNMPFLDNAMPI